MARACCRSGEGSLQEEHMTTATRETLKTMGECAAAVLFVSLVIITLGSWLALIRSGIDWINRH